MTYLSETLDYARFLATPTGLEPVTLCLEGRCSIQLSYGAVRRKIRCNFGENKSFPKISH